MIFCLPVFLLFYVLVEKQRLSLKVAEREREREIVLMTKRLNRNFSITGCYYGSSKLN